MSYANLHHKTHFSCGEAIGKPEDAIKYAQEIGLHSLAITDKFTMGGVFKFYDTAKEMGLPAVLGCQLNVFFDSSEKYEIVLLIKNQQGYHNLCRILTNAHKNTYKFDEPTCSIADLEDYREGLVLLTGSIEGPFGKDFLTLTKEEAYKNGYKRLQTLRSIFWKDLYFEVTLANEGVQWSSSANEYVTISETNPQIIVNKWGIKAAEALGIGAIVSSNSSIPRRDDKVLQDVVVRNSIKGKTGFYVRENRHVLDSQEIRAKLHLQGIFDKRIDNLFKGSIEASEKCMNPKLEFKDQVVNYPVIFHPLYEPDITKEELVYKIIRDNPRMQWENPAYVQRLEYELDTIIRNGKINLIDYFLVLEDLCRWCRDNGIIVGPGRGSGAGSLLNYCLQITHLDPMKNGLLFERFISEVRIQKGTYPDIDLDFSDREAVNKYIGDTYGWDRVKPISTFQTMRVKTCIKDAFRLYYPDVEFKEINQFTTKFPKKEELETEVEYYDRSLEEDENIDHFLNKKYPKAGETVRNLIGFNRQTGVHPCGIAITQDPLESIVPIVIIRGRQCLDYALEACERVGVIKYDNLSIITLKFIQTATKLIKERFNIDIDIYNIPTDDKVVLESFLIETTGTFQFDSPIARSILTRIHTEGLEDLSLVTSAGRPGPMKNDQHIEFIQRKNKTNKSTAPHPSLEDTLKETYGIMMYQESVMQASVIMGGFSLSEADDIRKAMGKKKKNILKPYKDKFISYASKNFDDVDEERGGEIWHLMETFAGYGFNKSHSMSYAYIGYICQYLKIHYPIEWWMGCLTHSIDKNEKFFNYYKAAKDIINHPDVNNSTDEFFITDDGKIQMPYSVIKGVGDRTNEEIQKARPYTSFKDFHDRVYKRVINKGVMIKLIFAGFFDAFNKDKEGLLQEYFVELRKEKIPEQYEHITREKIIEYEKGSLDFIQIDYYNIYPKAFFENNVVHFDEIDGKKTDSRIVIGGLIKEMTIAKTKKKEEYVRLVLENCSKEIKVTIWPGEYQLYSNILKEGMMIKVKAKVGYYNNYPQVVATHVFTIPQAIKIALNRSSK